tara:strand:+ start:56 stop:511 length:456 start_codon:yes stop_codon:yes gene_type:complete
MKNFLAIAALFVPLTAAIAPNDDPGQAIDLPAITIDTISNEQVLQAIISVESEGRDDAHRVIEDAVGCLQIRRTMVRDVNRILRRNGSDIRYSYKDRWNRQSSIEMFDIYCKHYNLTTPEEKARCWNGGPKGLQKLCTKRYWEKVKRRLNG